MPQPVTYRGMTLIVPDNDSEWKEYFAHARQHRLMLRACKACGLVRYPATHACPWCMDLGWTWKEVSGRGTIYSARLSSDGQTVVYAAAWEGAPRPEIFSSRIQGPESRPLALQNADPPVFGYLHRDDIVPVHRHLPIALPAKFPQGDPERGLRVDVLRRDEFSGFGYQYG